MNDSLTRLGESILKEGERAKFRNERIRFTEFVDAIAERFAEAVLPDHTLSEPFRSLAFIVTVGQRPVTSLLILDILLNTAESPINGKKIGGKLAETLNISAKLTTKGGNYQDRIGDLISTFVKIGILESVSSDKSSQFEEGFRIKDSAMMEVKAFVNCFKLSKGVFSSFKPLKFEDLFKERFDRKIKHVIKSGTRKKQPFSIGKVAKSLLDPRLDLSFEIALRIIEDIEPKLKTGMTTLEIQSMLYNALKKHDEKAAENYRLTYPEILRVSLISGEVKVVNYKLVKDLINEEAKLKLTRNLLDKFASTVYNVVTRNPKNYQNETAVREYISALVHSECMRIRSDAGFVRDQLEKATSALEGCRNSMQSEEIGPARELFVQFLRRICRVILVQFRYLPMKNVTENADLISNLLREQKVMEELKNEFKLTDNDLTKFQRIKFLVQSRSSAPRKSLLKMVDECDGLLALCSDILRKSGKRTEPKPITIKVSEEDHPSRITTGYEELDNLLLGGIPENYAVILTSPSCDEKDLLIERFAEDGVKKGQIVLHITIDAGRAETLAEEFQSSFFLFVCNPEADAIIKNLPNVYKLKGVDNLNEINIALTSVLRKIEKMPKMPRRACVEIVSDVLLQHQTVSTRRWLAALIPKLKSNGFTTLAVMNPHMHSSQEVQAILDLFQGEIGIYQKQTEKGVKRFLRIEKMYKQKYLETELLLKKDKIQRKTSGANPSE